MESLLLERLENEMSYLAALQSVLERGTDNSVRIINLEYVKGKIDELRWFIDLIKQLEQVEQK